MVLTTLASEGVDYSIIDGADPAQKTKRNELFALSGRRAEYPQFFLSQPDGLLKFWGGWEEFQIASENQGIASEFQTIDSSNEGSISNDETKPVEAEDEISTSSQEKDEYSTSEQSDTIQEADIVSPWTTDVAMSDSETDASEASKKDDASIESLESNSVTTRSKANDATIESTDDRSSTSQDPVEKQASIPPDVTEDTLSTPINQINDHESITVSVSSPETSRLLDNDREKFPALSSPVEGKSLLVLVSHQSIDTNVITNQEKALAILDSLGVGYNTLDGADPVNKERRNDLFGVSGRRAQYPQFFQCEGESMSFWGGYDEFQNAHDNDEITIQLGVVSKASGDENEEQEDYRISPMEEPDDHSLCISSTEDKFLLVLLSQQSIDKKVLDNQQNALTILNSLGVEYATLDGADPVNKEKRNELFGISGMYASYPQFFCLEGESVTFWGDWTRFEYAHDNLTLLREFSHGDASFQHEADHEIVTYVENDTDERCAAPHFDSIQDIVKEGTQSSDETGALYSDSDSETSCRQLLILLSRQTCDREVISNQEKALVALESNGINYEVLDGADAINRERRNELFSISGLRAKYPQFFVIHGSETSFWGDWEQFQETNESQRIAIEFGFD